MGDFGHLLSCLTIDMKEKISHAIGINLSCDTHRELVCKYVYTLKDLRNAIAHNDIVYDTRFHKMDASKLMKQCLILETGLPYMNFYLKLLKVSKTESKKAAAKRILPNSCPFFYILIFPYAFSFPYLFPDNSFLPYPASLSQPFSLPVSFSLMKILPLDCSFFSFLPLY